MHWEWLCGSMVCIAVWRIVWPGTDGVMEGGNGILMPSNKKKLYVLLAIILSWNI